MRVHLLWKISIIYFLNKVQTARVKKMNEMMNDQK